MLLGEFAALFTSFCWTMSAVGFSQATQVFGSDVTNRIRLALATLALLGLNVILYGWLLPPGAGGERWAWLTVSGLIGLALGDTFLFNAYRYVGPRLGLLLLSLAPIFGGGIAWIWFGEVLTVLQIVGILITLGGVSFVVFNRPDQNQHQDRHLFKGIVFGVLAALGQAVGLVLSKKGIEGDFPPFAASLIRMLVAAAAVWMIAAFRGQTRSSLQVAWEHPVSLGWVTFGAFFGPVIGVSASLLAIQHAEIGVASTLMALPPVFMLPVSHFGFRERVNWQSLTGTFAAIAGVAMLFLG